MTYSSGGLIEASDFNSIVGSTTGSGATINQIWTTGSNDCGYGQSAVATVASSNIIYASDWASMINTLNNIKNHQSGSGSGISAPTAGSVNYYLPSLSSALSGVYSNRLAKNSTGSTGSAAWSDSITSTGYLTTATLNMTRTFTFGNVDQARYFFNAGGKIGFNVISAYDNIGDTTGGDLVTLAYTNFNNMYIMARSGSGIGGTGGTVSVNRTDVGYYNLGTSYTTLATINDSVAYYSGEYAQFDVATDGSAGSNSGNGYQITMNLKIYSPGRNDVWQPLNVTFNYTTNVVYPETTYLGASWGTVTLG